MSFSMFLSLSLCLSSIAAISIILFNYDCLWTLSLQFFFPVCASFFEADSNASISGEISFNLSLDFELFVFFV